MDYSSYYNSIQNSIVQRYLAMGPEGERASRHAPIIRNLLTEELLKSELAPHLPFGLEISKGEVVDKSVSSGDCDLIIYRRPVIYQYGPVAIVSRENTKAIIDVEIHGERFLKSFFQAQSKHSKKVTKAKARVERLEEFADKILCVGLHGHAKSKIFEWWNQSRHDYKGKTPIFILYTRHDSKIVDGEFERLIREIQKLA